MSWQAILKTLPLLTLNDTEIFAPPREMEAAIASYNRALVNLRSDSADVAQIALRKLVINYPLFGPAALLFAIGMTEQHRYAAAREIIERAQLAGLSTLETRLAEALLGEIPEKSPPAPLDASSNSKVQPSSKSQTANKLSGRTEANTATLDQSPILMKTGRPARAKMASRREVKNVLRRGDNQPQETFVQKSHTDSFLRKLTFDWALIGKITGITVAGALLIFGLYSLINFFPAQFNRTNRPPTDQERLSFLLSRLEELTVHDAQIAAIMSDYQAFVQPSADTASAASTSNSMPGAESSATEPATDDPTEPSETTEAVSPGDLLTQIFHEYEAAMILASSDVVTAAENLYQLKLAAEALDSSLVSPAVPLTVGELQTKISESLEMYRTDAAEALRIQGREAYDIKDHAVSLEYYLRAYTLKPLAYGGGVAYYCGRNYQALGQNEKARPFYQFVIDNFAGSEVAEYATVRLQEIG